MLIQSILEMPLSNFLAWTLDRNNFFCIETFFVLNVVIFSIVK